MPDDFDPTIWKTARGEEVAISSMETSHLMHAVNKIKRSEDGWRKEYLDRLEMELERRQDRPAGEDFLRSYMVEGGNVNFAIDYGDSPASYVPVDRVESFSFLGVDFGDSPPSLGPVTFRSYADEIRSEMTVPEPPQQGGPATWIGRMAERLNRIVHNTIEGRHEVQSRRQGQGRAGEAGDVGNDRPSRRRGQRS